MKVLVTGASGFIGGALLQRLRSCSDLESRAALRGKARSYVAGMECVSIGEIDGDTNWGDAVRGIDVIIHAAARVHVVRDAANEPLVEYRRVNVEGTLNLARQAAEAGVRRFTFLSSIKVNGEETSLGRPYRPDDSPSPADPYAISKLEAENGLRQLLAKTSTSLVIVRPALVYGPDVRGNFLTMMRCVHRSIPLPFAGVQNRRSFTALDNLVDLLLVCSTHPAAPGHVLLAADGEDLSTSELLMRIASHMNKEARLFRLPRAVLESGASLIGKGHLAQRLLRSLQVDIAKTSELLGWSPAVSVETALRSTVTAFLESSRR